VPMLLPIHILSAALALVSGVVALSAPKGGMLHRRSGMVFTYTMIAMCGTAVVAAAIKGQAVNLVAGVMTAYLVLTGLLTVQRPSAGSRRRDIALMVVALVSGSVMIGAGIWAIVSPSGRIFGYPPFPFFLFGVLGLSGGAGDWRLIRSGPPRGGPRLARHLWRMCMALFIAIVSFVSIRQRVAALFPAPFASPAARIIPVVMVLWAMGYWLWRVRSSVAPTGGVSVTKRVQDV
jgi:uncharacterized membrane protein